MAKFTVSICRSSSAMSASGAGRAGRPSPSCRAVLRRRSAGRRAPGRGPRAGAARGPGRRARRAGISGAARSASDCAREESAVRKAVVASLRRLLRPAARDRQVVLRAQDIELQVVGRSQRCLQLRAQLRVGALLAHCIRAGQRAIDRGESFARLAELAAGRAPAPGPPGTRPSRCRACCSPGRAAFEVPEGLTGTTHLAQHDSPAAGVPPARSSMSPLAPGVQ